MYICRLIVPLIVISHVILGANGSVIQRYTLLKKEEKLLKNHKIIYLKYYRIGVLVIVEKSLNRSMRQP